MKSRIVGSAVLGSIGFFVGAGTGIVGGAFGAVAGVSIFTTIGVFWGWSLGPDISRAIGRFKNPK